MFGGINLVAVEPGTEIVHEGEKPTVTDTNAAHLGNGQYITETHVAALRVHSSVTTRKAARCAQTISLLWNYADKELDWPLGKNPASGPAKYEPAREYEAWPDWMVKMLATAPKNVQIAAELIRGTGQRPSAAINMRHDQFSEDWMEVLNEKSDEMFPAFCPPRLREFVGGIRKPGAHILAKNLREPRGYDAIEKSFRPWRNDLGERAQKYTLHGLRKLAVIELAEAGASHAEIRAVTGQSAQMIASYRAQVNRKMRSRNAQGRRE